MKDNESHYKYKEINKFGQFPLELESWLFDNAPQKLEVDYRYLQQVLVRLVDLDRLAKTHLAESDIPNTIKYLLSVVPNDVSLMRKKGADFKKRFDKNILERSKNWQIAEVKET